MYITYVYGVIRTDVFLTYFSDVFGCIWTHLCSVPASAVEQFEEVMRKQLCDQSEARPEAPTNQKHPGKHKGDKANHKQQLKREHSKL